MDRRDFARAGHQLAPDTALADCPKDIDLLFVPGGTMGTVRAMEDPEVLSFLADRARNAAYVTSVCTGSLVLGAAGLLEGKRATSHWAVRDSLLPIFGAKPAANRVVVDGNVVTGAGVSAGIGFAIYLMSVIYGEEMAKIMQLNIEYDPEPPFRADSPEQAGPEVTAALRTSYTDFVQAAERAARAARRRGW